MDPLRHVNLRDDAECALLAEHFQTAYPYPHVCIDNFFAPSFMQSLADDFPRRGEPDHDRFCIEDGGVPGDNYANGDASTFPPAFAELDRLSPVNPLSSPTCHG